MKSIILILNLWLEHQVLSSFSLPNLQKVGGKENLHLVWIFMNMLMMTDLCCALY